MSLQKESTKKRVLESALIQYIRQEESTENIKDALDIMVALSDLEEDEFKRTN